MNSIATKYNRETIDMRMCLSGNGLDHIGHCGDKWQKERKFQFFEIKFHSQKAQKSPSKKMFLLLSQDSLQVPIYPTIQQIGLILVLCMNIENWKFKHANIENLST